MPTPSSNRLPEDAGKHGNDGNLFASIACLVVRARPGPSGPVPATVSAVSYVDGAYARLAAGPVRCSEPSAPAAAEALGLERGAPDAVPDLAACAGAMAERLPSGCTLLVFGEHEAQSMVLGLLPVCPRLDVREIAGILLPTEQVEGIGDVARALGVEADGDDADLLLDCFAALAGRALELPLPALEAIYRVLPAAANNGISLTSFFETALMQVRAQWAQTMGEPYVPPTRHGDAFLATLLDEPLPKPRNDIPDLAQCRPVCPDEVATILGDEGAIAQYLGKYEFREEQVKMARSVCEAFNGGSHLLAEAGTGVGKSLAYLVPSIVWAVQNDTPVVVSTNTKNLQSQLFDKDIPLLKEALGFAFRVALIRGRTNYLCLRKFLNLVDNTGFELGLDGDAMPQRVTLARLLAWLPASATGDVTDLSDWDRLIREGWGRRLTAAAEECAGRACRHWRQCLLRRARAKALAADVVVANHSLVFAEMGQRSVAIPPHAQIVFDEAHNLEESATRHFSTELSQLRLRFLTRRLGDTGRGYRGGQGKGLLGTLVRQAKDGAITNELPLQERIGETCDAASALVPLAEAAAGPFFSGLASVLKRTGGRTESVRLDGRPAMPADWESVLAERDTFSLQIDRLAVAVDAILQALGEVGDDGLGFHMEHATDLATISQSLKEYLSDMSFVLAASDPEFVYWVERSGRGNARAIAAPISISRRLCESLYMQKQSCIFVSATLSVRGQFEFLRQRLGLDLLEAERIRTLAVGSPFDYQNQCLLLVPMFLPDPGGGEGDYAAELGRFMARLFERTQGRALGLFTSYDTMRRARESLLSDVGPGCGRILMQGEDGSRDVITDTFRHDPQSVLLGTHSFWEGVDVVGDSLSCLVVTRLPFAVFTEPIFAARCEKIEEQGGSAFRSYSLPHAVIRFRQGFGRLIRHREDRGVVVVTDRRLFTKSYGQWFRASVPATTRRCYTEEQFMDALGEFLA